MKKLILTTTIVLIGLNISLLPYFNYQSDFNNRVNDTLDNLNDNQALLYSTEYSGTPRELENILSTVSGVESIDFNNTYNNYEVLDTTKNTITIKDNNFNGGLTVPFKILEKPSNQKLPIISGENLNDNDQVVLSSSLLDYLDYNYDDVIGQYTNNLQIVGVYEDPNPFSQVTDKYVFNNPSVSTYTSNGGYTTDSTLKEQQLSQYSFMDDNDEDFLINSQAVVITFNSEVNEHLDDLNSALNQQSSIYTNGKIVNNSLYNDYNNTQHYLNSIKIALGIINFSWILLIIGYFKTRR